MLTVFHCTFCNQVTWVFERKYDEIVVCGVCDAPMVQLEDLPFTDLYLNEGLNEEYLSYYGDKIYDLCDRSDSSTVKDDLLPGLLELIDDRKNKKITKCEGN